MSIPAVVIAAPNSGSGKTTIATGLMGAFRRAGRTVAPFKVGPDFIDPGYHALAAGRPGRNLDPVMVGEHLIGPLYQHGSAGADIAIVEGVMGLFDGRIDTNGGPARGSTAHVAGLLGAPVVLVVDARGQSHSIAALLHGFSTFDQSVRMVGVILNRVGSPRHEQVLRQACEQAGVQVLGSIPRADELSVPSRHLGLVTATEHGVRARQAVDAMTTLVARHVDLDAVVAAAASRVGAAPWTPEADEPVAGAVTVALAAGKAFTFGYPEHAELLRGAGADVVEFDPLTDGLPLTTDALVIPGGFPEQFTAELSANAVVRQQIKAMAARGAPIHAECAGLTYLVDDLDGHPMCGVVSGTARFTERLTLGYRDAVALEDSPLHAAGSRVVGHEFHRTAVTFACGQAPAWAFRDGAGAAVTDGVVTDGVHAAYLHAHAAAHPGAATRFVAAAKRVSDTAAAASKLLRVTENAYFVGLRLGGKKVVVVGGGSVAQRRIPLLLANGADVHVIARAATPAVEAFTELGAGITLHLRDYVDGDLDEAWYAIAATDDPAVNEAIVAEADRQRIFCVRADVARDGSAVTPASFEYEGLSVGVLAGGEHRRSAAIRTAIHEALQSGVIADEVPAALHGAVALVGGGPGDPELITVRGRRLLAQADVVVADRLAPPELLAELAPHVEVIDASKIPYGRSMAQDAINAVLIDRATAGNFVVRLKGGDPYVFARGHEEVLACVSAGIPVTVVPGVTSAIAVPAMTGVPVTHRGITHEFVVVSGHLAPGHPESLVNWDALAALSGTIVLLMAVERIELFAKVLLAGGRPAETPVMVVQHGTTAAQRTLRTTLVDAAEHVRADGIRPPAIIVIGAVAAFAD